MEVCGTFNMLGLAGPSVYTVNGSMSADMMPLPHDMQEVAAGSVGSSHSGWYVPAWVNCRLPFKHLVTMAVLPVPARW
jgi:hypothetical protein